MRKVKGFFKKYRGMMPVFFLMLLSPALMATLQKTKDAYGLTHEIDTGKKVYQERCLICHGVEGNGKGPVDVVRRAEKTGRIIEIYSRDFTVGVFKFRSTPTGCLPTDDDILGTIADGIERSFMPSHKEVLSSEEREAVKEYIKAFSFRWEEEDPCDAITVKKPEGVDSPAFAEKGKMVYKEMKCWECHGYQGVGDGPKADDLKDDWGKQIRPFDFTTGALKRGSSPENVYITFTTGLDGTGMPAYEDSPSEEDRWHLVAYTLKLMKLKGRAE
ncbi:c-type cytochrome [Candidatus Desulfatibia sp.]|uniref:c-type cytochrome n=1 Tax=Candidatus Desulfatibia sp. TaxID=3101189 RepID=UPI0039B86925